MRARIGRDGKARPLDPIGLRYRIADALSADPTASIRAIAGRVGASQGTVRDVRARTRRGEDVLSPRLARLHQRDQQAATLANDEACRSTAIGSDFLEWFETHRLIHDRDWERFVGAVPLSRVYEVADTARCCSQMWAGFARALEDRARTSRR